jgi:hypothetical protein
MAGTRLVLAVGQDLTVQLVTGYFPFYNDEHVHAALDYLAPAAMYAAA